MTNRSFNVTNRRLGVLGLFLMLVVARLADLGYSTPESAGARLAGFLARRGIDGVAVIGWLIDRFPVPATRFVVAPTGIPSAARSGATAGRV